MINLTKTSVVSCPSAVDNAFTLHFGGSGIQLLPLETFSFFVFLFLIKELNPLDASDSHNPKISPVTLPPRLLWISWFNRRKRIWALKTFWSRVDFLIVDLSGELVTMILSCGNQGLLPRATHTERTATTKNTDSEKKKTCFLFQATSMKRLFCVIYRFSHS